MSERKRIDCVSCGEWCGWYVPADRDDPAYRYGYGEDWETKSGDWCCSRECLREAEEEEVA